MENWNTTYMVEMALFCDHFNYGYPIGYIKTFGLEITLDCCSGGGRSCSVRTSHKVQF